MNLGSERPPTGRGRFPGTPKSSATISEEADDVRTIRDRHLNAALWVRQHHQLRWNTMPPSTWTGTVDSFNIKNMDLAAQAVHVRHAAGLKKTKEKDLPSWAIWEYNIHRGHPAPVISSDTTPDEGQDPRTPVPAQRHSLPRRAERQSQAILRDKDKPGSEARTDDKWRTPSSCT